MNRKYPLTVLRLLSMLCLIAALAACAPRPAVSTPTTPSLPTTTAQSSIGEIASNKIILIGSPDALDDIVTTDNNFVSNTPAPDHQIFGKLMTQESFNSKSAFSSQGSNVVVRVYEHLGPPETLVNDVQYIDKELKAKNSPVHVDFDLHVQSAASDSTPCANPHSGGGSPVGEVIKDIIRKDPNPLLNEDAFKKQWAFGNIGWPSALPPIDPLAEKPAIIIVDTAPKQYQGTNSAQPAPLNGSDTFKNLTKIAVEDTIYKNNPNTPTPTPKPGHAEETSHSWVIAGIAQYILTSLHWDADIYVYRVLDDYGCGDMDLIGKTIIDAINELDNGKRPILINASFGVTYDPRISISPNTDTPNGIALFQYIVDNLPQHHAIMVAASGNNSSLNNVMAPNYPAAIDSDSVIAVASSTMENGRSCFSNRGEIAAPGGNGDPNNNCNPIDTRELPGLCSLDKISECPYKIMGPVKESSSGFGAWAGTSFATDFIDAALGIILANPEVQGDQRLAVCMLEKGATRPQSDSQYLGYGIVNIEASLSEETINKCKTLYP
jgi:hypothetical protein